MCNRLIKLTKLTLSFTIIKIDYQLKIRVILMVNSMEILKEKLKETGFKITPQRRAIIEILLKNDSKHLSSEEIYDLVRVNCPEIGLATVYRTMQLLDEVGAISKLNLDDGCIRYELNLNDEHCHFRPAIPLATHYPMHLKNPRIFEKIVTNNYTTKDYQNPYLWFFEKKESI